MDIDFLPMSSAPKEQLPDRAPIKRWAKIRLWAGYLFMALALVYAQPNRVGAIIGLISVVMGMALRLTATATLVKDKVLCMSGIYGVTRNPLYLGSSMIGLGVAFLTGSYWFFLGFFLILVPLYIRMIIIEEEFLAKLYPESFKIYINKVPRFFPSFSALFTNQPGELTTPA